MLCFAVSLVQAQHIASTQQLEKIRAHLGPTVNYEFFDVHGNWYWSREFTGTTYYLLNVQAKTPTPFMYSPEIDHLTNSRTNFGAFGAAIDSDSLLSTPTADYMVLRMARPIEYNPGSPRQCAKAEERNYLIAVVNHKIKILDRHFLYCTDQYTIIQNDKQVGYEVISYRKAQTELINYFLKDGKIIKKQRQPYQEADKETMSEEQQP